MQVEGPLGRLLLPIPAFLIVMETSRYWYGPLPEGSTVGSPEYALGIWGSISVLIITMWVIEKGSSPTRGVQTDTNGEETETESVQTPK